MSTKSVEEDFSPEKVAPEGAAPLAEADEEGADLVEAMQDHLFSYDTRLYYATKEYVELHTLYHKQQQRRVDSSTLPFRYELLLMWSSPLATKKGICFFAFQILLIVATLVQIFFESTPRYNPDFFPKYGSTWDAMEIPIATCFTIELIVHFVLLPPMENDFSRASRGTFFRKKDTWIDIVTILPTILAGFREQWPVVRSLEFFKTLRVLRLTKVLRQIPSVDPLAFALEKCMQPLLGPLALLFGLVYTLSAAIYFVEKGDYDSETGKYMIDDCDCLQSPSRVLDPTYPCAMMESKFVSIPHTFWFTLVTVTTQGYGDMVPMCRLGRILSSIAMITGTIVIAMPIAIVGSYFTSIVLENKTRKVGNPKAFGRKARMKDEWDIIARPFGSFGGILGSVAGSIAFDEAHPGISITLGYRLLSQLSKIDMQFDLLHPPAVVLHRINAFIKYEFDRFLQTFNTKEGKRAVSGANSSSLGVLCLR